MWVSSHDTNIFPKEISLNDVVSTASLNYQASDNERKFHLTVQSIEDVICIKVTFSFFLPVG